MLFDRLWRHVLAHQVGKTVFAHRGNHFGQIGRVQNVVALLVNHFALVVGHVVVFEQLLAHVKVARLDLALRRLDAAGNDTGFDGLAVGHFEAIHDGFDTVAGENAHQRVVQAQVEARRARITLTARAATQLVVNAARFVALGGDDAQAAQRLDFFVLDRPIGAQLRQARLLGAFIQRFVGFNRQHVFFDIAAEHDVGAATGHVGGNGDHLGAAGLGDDVGLAGVLLGVEHLVRQVRLIEQLVDDFGVLNRRSAHQHRLAALVALADVFDRRFVFFARGFINAV